jgi:DNA-binding MarR family transcriptional regulator
MDESLTRLVTVAAHLLELRLDKALRAVGISMRQFHTLSVIASDPGVSRAELAKQLQISPQAAGGLTLRLAAAGLIERPTLRSGVPTPHRLTDAGIRRLQDATSVIAAGERGAVQSLPEASLSSIRDGLRALVAILYAGDSGHLFSTESGPAGGPRSSEPA